MNNLDNKKVAFIICANNDTFLQECIFYINKINIPEGFSIEVMSIADAEYITAAYNAAMQASDAKYKVYLHQDVFILNRNIISDIVKLFEDETIGMIGLLGASERRSSASYAINWDVGQLQVGTVNEQFELGQSGKRQDVVAIDGMFMATQYDVPWNEELRAWDFYDISQSVEFMKRGYRIVLPKQEQSWILHDLGYCNMTDYDQVRKLFCDIYKEYGYVYKKEDDFPCREILEEFVKQKGEFKHIVETETIQNLNIYADKLEKIYKLDTELWMLKVLLSIREKECENGRDSDVLTSKNWDMELERYSKIKFLLRRIENGFDYEEYKELIELMLQGKISATYVYMTALYSTINPGNVWNTVIGCIQ